ncbi:MAG TPA: response regulator [Actinomycetota bacterium]|nr:response regulator [Actinomycetota bacterium]
MSVLLVEDNPDDVALIQRAFRKANIANPLRVVTDGEEAVAYLAGRGEYADRARHPLPVLVLLDLKLPKRSGHEVLAWLRSQEGLRRLPVAVLTSSREAADVNRAYDLGANAYLQKPVGFEALHELVGTLNLFWLILNEKPDLCS